MKEIQLKELLESYSACKKYLRSQEYAKNFFGTDGAHEKGEYEARIDLVERLIKLIDEPSDKYTILRLRYIEGLSVVKCAECMGVSYRTGYRILDKAIKSLYCIVRRKEVLEG